MITRGCSIVLLIPFLVLPGLLLVGCGEDSAAAPARSAARSATGTLEALTATLDAAPVGAAEFELWVPAQITLNGEPVERAVVLPLLANRARERGLRPGSEEPGEGGRLVRFVPLEEE